MNHYINKVTFSEKLKTYRKHPLSFVMLLIIFLGAILTIGTLLYLIAYILITGIPNIKPELFEWEYNSENVSMMPAIINTITMTFLTLLMAVPVGIFSAIYLVEYAKKGNSGAITLAIMILPLIIRTTEEALLAVPDSYREGSFGLGAGKLRTVFRAVLPSAVPGILAGVILAIGRIVGETAALIYTSGTVTGIPENLMDSGRTLSVHMYALLSEGLYMEQAYATSVVLLVLVLGINTLSGFIAKKVGKV